MSVMFEVYCGAPADAEREAQFSQAVEAHGGKLTYREASEHGPVVLTFEFSSWDAARQAALELRSELRLGEHIDGPMDYGDD